MTAINNTLKTFELTPINGRKSFYGKCRVFEENGISKLLSYDTIVAQYTHETNKMEVFDIYSSTTLNHIKAFLDFYGFDAGTKKEIEETYLK